ncbi:N-acetyl-gamma-glutamyl-phosphate reductase [Christensenellaceae bacterium OttesenSCG-928-K19]|nr:N-acetyl-gamma-glutamyl-phosphate reductase [Christensenellaceae bacterium OttesenSCG-928-K19]
MVNVGVIGATGYVGEELLRLLHAHNQVNVTCAVSKNFAGKNMGDVYSNFAVADDIPLSSGDYASIGKANDFVFLCLPHGQSIQAAPKLMDAGARVIDLSGDFRYEDTAIYEEWYGMTHTEKEKNDEAVYGLPEYFFEAIKNARLLANPGCYTTTSILALAPLLQNRLIEKNGIVIDAKSGVSGAGRKEQLAFSYCETADNFKAYSVIKHRHTSEIEEQLFRLCGNEITLLFTPHLLPVKRGILATIYAQLAPGVDAEKIATAYKKAYEKKPFAHILPTGALPELKQVVGSNNCVIGFDISERTGRVVIVSCTDNLIKGAAGQAIQNFNIMNGFDEAHALPRVAWYL